MEPFPVFLILAFAVFYVVLWCLVFLSVLNSNMASISHMGVMEKCLRQNVPMVPRRLLLVLKLQKDKYLVIFERVWGSGGGTGGNHVIFPY